MEADSVGYDDTGVEEPTAPSTSIKGVAVKAEPAVVVPDIVVLDNVSSFSGKSQHDNNHQSVVSKQGLKEKVVATTPVVKAPKISQSKSQASNADDRKQEAESFGVKIVKSGGKRMIDLNSLIQASETKFNGRARLFIANLQNGISEEDIRHLFGKFGETNEVYVNKEKGFGFVRLVSEDC